MLFHQVGQNQNKQTNKHMKRNKEWLANKNATKNPKLFNVNIFRDASGELHLVGGDTEVYDKRIQEWVPVNTRAFGNMINSQGIHTA